MFLFPQVFSAWLDRKLRSLGAFAVCRTGRTTGFVLDIGEGVTQCVPVFDGKIRWREGSASGTPETPAADTASENRSALPEFSRPLCIAVVFCAPPCAVWKDKPTKQGSALDSDDAVAKALCVSNIES